MFVISPQETPTLLLLAQSRQRPKFNLSNFFSPGEVNEGRKVQKELEHT